MKTPTGCINLKTLLSLILAGSLVFSGCSDDDEGPLDSNPPEPVLLEQVTPAGVYNPTLSPDGLWLAHNTLESQIVKRSFTEDLQETLTEYGAWPDWSPVDDVIVFTGDDDSLGRYLGTVDTETGDTTFLWAGYHRPPVAWSPDGTRIAAFVSDGLATIAYPGGTLTEITCLDSTGNACEGLWPAWSPDGQALAFGNGRTIFRLNLNNDTASVIINDTTALELANPAWSPNGLWIAFARREPADWGWEIWVTDIRGPQFGLWELTSSDSGTTALDINPCWSSGSDIIYFESYRGGGNDPALWRIGFQPL